MKKVIALFLVLALAFTLCACGKKAEETPQTATSGEGKEMVQGTLSMLNITEEEFAAYQEARRVLGRQLIKEGYVERTEGTSNQGRMTKIVFYDTLDALLMALNVGDINEIAIYQSVARYLCATNDNLCMPIRYDLDKERNTFAEVVLNSFVNNNDFAFLMMESSAALRDEFNAAIADMKADGTLDRLVKEQIDDLVNGGEIKPIALPKIDGAETVKVAVTGALPPMDYVAADGTPAGFNTAVLAEIGQRTGKNIELVVVDSVGRATALASGTVDAVFWTRTSSASQERASMTEAEREAGRKKIETGMTEEEINLMNEMRNHIDFLTYGTADMPEGTIVTEPYFSDVLVPVMLAGGGPQGK